MANREHVAARPDPPTLEHATRVRRLAARAWVEMDAAGVPPTPRHFELWYTHLDGDRPELSRRLLALVDGGTTPTDAALGTLYAECVAPAPEPDVGAIADGAEAIQQAARDVVEQIAGNGTALREYGDALARAGGQLGEERTVEGLLRAVATLSAETAHAGERNRVLEQRLSASAAHIARLRHALVEVKEEATTDALTGLCNRRAFDARLRRAMARAKAEGDAVSVLLLDVDHFKRVNDTHGHKLGDLVLRLVGRLLADNVKGKDTAARYGGEEFAVILTGADLRAGAIVAEQMRAALDGKRPTKTASGEGFGVTLSAGVARLRPGESAAELVGRADAALYRAKRAGRNRVRTEDAAVEAPAA